MNYKTLLFFCLGSVSAVVGTALFNGDQDWLLVLYTIIGISLISLLLAGILFLCGKAK
ncbi:MULTISPECIES: hypothetical protein [unclassified Motilimonas]|uniref:hypothetical protein n=1 Tax=Motilimonas TaxID=1914248 RepID=UPI001E32A3EF|nr:MULTISPECIES: hypothetical protein [unclassified Motilimonas]MCE0557469.1 hypothetical protein [Motilimonas sp. E26]MDO6525756.1 hypothetical protein [Motilimonas sp. 1_MG-2023]